MDTQILTQDFKQAMRRLAATATIICTSDGNERFGMSATAVTSLSTDPPSLLVCVNRNASIHPSLAVDRSFSVNVLQAQHQNLCIAFGGKVAPADRFDDEQWATDSGGVPYLSGAGATVFCKVSKVIDHASHSIVIGDVYAASTTETGSPLLYGDGGFLTAA